ncbi:hypothetical protein BHE74_00040124 [Ensete ventricosum]|nr:hypothetical protein BHE74_00040124 [Ensete ventricosum]
MKNSWNNIIPLLPLQEFMSLTSVQGKLHVSTPCSIFYVNSLHAAWILQLLHPLICIEFMVALVPTISRVSPLLSLIFTSALVCLHLMLPWQLPHLISQCIHQCITLCELMRRLLAACLIC